MPDEADELIEETLGSAPPAEPEASTSTTQKPSTAQTAPSGNYSLPLRVGKTGQPLDDGDGTGGEKPWIIGTFLPGVALNAKHPHGHMGVDVAGPKGVDVYPIGPGKVIEVQDYPKSGHSLKIQHDPDTNLVSFYAHLNEVLAHVGQIVDSNTIIGKNGNTGNAFDTAAHVHFQTKLNGTDVDPMGVIGKPYGSFIRKAMNPIERLTKMGDLFLIITKA